MANRIVLPPSGLSFQHLGASSDDQMFGAGWMAWPLFHGDHRTRDDGNDTTSLTWTFVGEAANFRGPIVAYPPHMFTRRIAEWKAFRKLQNPSLDEDFLNVNPLKTLAHVGPNQSADAICPSGEFPNLPVVFSDNNNRFWKILKRDNDASRIDPPL